MFQKFNNFTKLAITVGLLLISYDYVARALNVYFFWESGPVGWYLVLLGCIALCLKLIDAKQTIKASAVFEKTVLYFLVFVLVIKTVVLGAMLSSDAFAAAKNYLKTNSRVSNELGIVSGVVWLPTGAISTANNSDGESGEGTLNVIAKGERKYRQYEIQLIKKPTAAQWQVVAIAAVE